MEVGFVWSPARLQWLKEPTRYRPAGETMGKRWLWLPETFPGWRCSECRLTLFDYGRVV